MPTDDILANIPPKRRAILERYKLERERKERLLRAINPPKNYCPDVPTERQELFLGLIDDREALYGGAAGGGKSNALLADALKYVHIPNYAALLVRRTYADLSKPGALMDRAQQWLKRSDAKWNGQDKQWRFPSGSTLSFGYLDTENDKYHFQGAEFQYIGVDEITQFNESQYLYLFSRLRRLKGANVPVRMRAATNPGGVGGRWVYDRFIPEGFSPADAIEPKVHWKEGLTEEGRPFRRAFVPARLSDNPHLDQEEYEQNLYELDPVTREQLLRGDWQITERGDILTTYSEPHTVITWSEFESVFGVRHIPKHWLLGVYQDWGATEDHPCVTNWFATASKNTPPHNGVKMADSVFLYRGLTMTDCTLKDVAEKIKAAMTPHGEISRTTRWQMSHEALSERLGYNREHGLSFAAWKTGKTRGITQLKTAFELVDVDKRHPFNTGLTGHPRMYLIVDDEEWRYARTDAGLVRHRAEIVAYHWNVMKSGEPMTTLLPYPLFNDAIDGMRAAAADYFPASLELSTNERIELATPAPLQWEVIQERREAGEDIRGALAARTAEQARIRENIDKPCYSSPTGAIRDFRSKRFR